ncbi:MAG TPA: hypothetical protein PKC79_12490 [Solidesulfovibrio magneticus]|nr:hypothetical protein [Solidesulfovibrio magneticus]
MRAKAFSYYQNYIHGAFVGSLYQKFYDNFLRIETTFYKWPTLITLMGKYTELISIGLVVGLFIAKISEVSFWEDMSTIGCLFVIASPICLLYLLKYALSIYNGVGELQAEISSGSVALHGHDGTIEKLDNIFFRDRIIYFVSPIYVLLLLLSKGGTAKIPCLQSIYLMLAFIMLLLLIHLPNFIYMYYLFHRVFSSGHYKMRMS